MSPFHACYLLTYFHLFLKKSTKENAPRDLSYKQEFPFKSTFMKYLQNIPYQFSFMHNECILCIIKMKTFNVSLFVSRRYFISKEMKYKRKILL